MDVKALIKRYPSVDRLVRRMYGAVPARLRLGQDFFYWYALHQQAEQWSQEQVDEFKADCFRQLISEVSQTIPYYRDMFAGKVLPDLSDLPKVFPALTRDMFSAWRAEMTRDTPLAGTYLASTSGTTGNALQFKHTLLDNKREWASICHQWRRVGYDPLTSVRAEFRALVDAKGIVQAFPESTMIRCSILHLKSEHIRHYADVCQANRVEFLHGYPSALFLVARQVLDSGIVFSGIRGVLLSSEMVYPHQLDAIEAAFPGARIISHYGSAERVALASWCEHSRHYHFLPLYSHVEVEPLTGALIGTNLFNRINPFIRYRMSDVMSGVTWSSCRSCGRRGFPMVEEIRGREEDYLYSPLSGWLPPAIVTYPLKSLRAIHEIQLFQEAPDLIEFRYTVRQGGEATDEVAGVCAGLGALLPNVSIVPHQYESFSRGVTGKFKWIDSPLSRNRSSLK